MTNSEKIIEMNAEELDKISGGQINSKNSDSSGGKSKKSQKLKIGNGRTIGGTVAGIIAGWCLFSILVHKNIGRILERFDNFFFSDL